jgi:hypothetical protein
VACSNQRLVSIAHYDHGGQILDADTMLVTADVDDAIDQLKRIAVRQ